MKDMNKPRWATGEVHSPLRLAILACLKKEGPSDRAAIAQALDAQDLPVSAQTLRRTLNKLREMRLVHRDDDDQGELWAEGAPRLDSAATAGPAGDVAQPRRINVMHGPEYQPGAGLALRPGALDFKAITSHGGRC